MKKKILNFMLIVSILQALIVSLPLTASAASSGTCGDGVTWSIDNNQVLTITGNGTMEDYAYCQPWANIKKVKIGDGVKNIGKAVFRKHAYLTSVEIGNGVTVIGEEAFRECANLTSVKMGSKVSEIGDSAFIFCEKLTKVELPDSLIKVGRCAFMFTGLKNIKIPKNVTTIDVSAFQACDGFTNVVIPDSVTQIGIGAFSHCSALSTVKIGNGVTTIDDEAFMGCSSLTDIEIGKNTKSVCSYAFYECDSLKNVYYAGGKSDWERIYIGSENSCLTNATINYYKNLPGGENNIKVLLNGKSIKFDVSPQIINSRTMVPVRAIFEAMGASVTWKESTSTVTSKKSGTTVTMKINSKDMQINGKTKRMDVAPMIIDGRTLAPARFVAEAFGADVQWNENTKTVTISTK